MLSLWYYLCLFYTNYASTKKQCYVVSCSSVYILPPQIMGTIWSIGWDVRFCQYFRGSREFMSFNFSYASFMLSLRYCACGFYKDYAMTKMSPKKFCYVNTMLLCLFMLWWCYGSQYLSCLFEKIFHLTAILSRGRIFSKELLLCELPEIIWDSKFMTSKEAYHSSFQPWKPYWNIFN